jgi:hypothetical protein
LKPRVTKQSTLTDICFAVCTALHSAGTTAVLTGGSAATYYAPERYQSRDADFIVTMSQDGDRGLAALQLLGFRAEADRIYRHAETPYTLEFPPGPLAIGGEIVTDYDSILRGDEVLHVISRTDSVRDRLASFFHWADRSSLVTALAVAESGDIDLAVIKDWSQREGAMDKFREFHERLKRGRR